MKIIHITPSYKPAFVYGGPTMSIAKLCEALEEQFLGNKEQGAKSKEQIASTINKTKNRHCEKQPVPTIRESNLFTRAKNKEQELITNEPITTNEPLEIQVFTTTANGNEELDVKSGEPKSVDGVLVTYFKRTTKDHTHFSPALLLHLRSVLRQAQHDKSRVILHIHAWWNLVSILSCAIAKWYKVPVVLSPRGMLNSYSQTHKNSVAKNLLHQTIGKNLLQYCHLHFTSAKEKTNILPFLIDKKQSVIPNLIQLQKIEIESRINTNEEQQIINGHAVFKLIFLGRIERIKGLEILFQSLAALEFNYTLTIAGTGEQKYVESLKAKAENLKIEGKIDWVGQVKNTNKFKFLAKHNLLVLPSYSENFANVVLESLSVGTPVLVSEHVGIADYVIENNLGWVSNLQPELITRTILEASKDLEKRKNIRTSAPQKIADDFDDAILARRYLQMYGHVLNSVLL
ncbi:glycosyltransferase involved in cell wall biosynthesis [Pedobacter sp. UYEF25]